jgi:Co/Zn/Cd efflux system component
VNDLVDHDLTKLELLMFVVNVLCNHSNVGIGRRSAVGVSVVVALVIVIIKCGNAGVLADATVSLSTSAVVLPAKVERLEEQKNWHLDNSQEEQDNLNTSLAAVKLLAIDNRTRRKEHVDQHVQQTRR